MSRTTARFIGGFGRALMTIGVLILLFTGFQLWGTGLAEARAQSELDAEFESRLQRFRQATRPESSPSDDETRPPINPADAPPPLPADELPGFGEAAGRIVIPTIGVNKTIVHGVARDDLRKGPGHYPTSPLPGQPGNAAIAGHRTTHGAPFFDLDLLQPGDEIIVETLQGRFTYLVEAHDNGAGDQAGHFIVPPTATHVLDDQGDNRLTLTACHPKYSAAQRIIVTAQLASTAAPATPIPTAVDSRPATDESDVDGTLDNPAVDETAPSTEPSAVPSTVPSAEPSSVPSEGSSSPGAEAEVGSAPDTDAPDTEAVDSLGWHPEYAKPTALWAGITALVALGAWLAGRRWRRLPVYVVATVPLTASLFFCFTHLDKFLPAI